MGGGEGLPFIVLAVAVHLFSVVFGAVGDVGLAVVLEPV